MSDNPSIPARNALIDRERIRGASRMIPEGTDAAAVTDEHIQVIAGDVEIFRRAHKISRKEIARAIGYSPGVISEFIAGKYAGNRGQVALDLQAWLVEEEQRRNKPNTTQFVLSEVAKTIKGVAGYCLDHRRIGLVYGPDASGVGKTISLQAIHQELGPRRSTLVTVDKVDANPTGILRKICQAMSHDDSGSNRNRFERIAAHLNGRSHLLMIDQIHNLRGAKDDKPLYILTDLYDATNTAQLWCGTADMHAYLQRGRAKGDESLAQIRRRIFPCVDLMESCRADVGGEPLFTIDQVREIFAKNKLRLTPAASRFICQLANLPDSGSMGLCVSLVEYATFLAELQRQPSIDLAHLQEALRKALPPTQAEILLQQTKAAGETQRMTKVG